MPSRAACPAQSPPPASPFSSAQKSLPEIPGAARDGGQSSRNPNPRKAIGAAFPPRSPPASFRASPPPEISAHPLHPWRVLGKLRILAPSLRCPAHAHRSPHIRATLAPSQPPGKQPLRRAAYIQICRRCTHGIPLGNYHWYSRRFFGRENREGLRHGYPGGPDRRNRGIDFGRLGLRFAGSRGVRPHRPTGNGHGRRHHPAANRPRYKERLNATALVIRRGGSRTIPRDPPLEHSACVNQL